MVMKGMRFTHIEGWAHWYYIFIPKECMSQSRAELFCENLKRFRLFRYNHIEIDDDGYLYYVYYHDIPTPRKIQSLMMRVDRSWQSFMNGDKEN